MVLITKLFQTTRKLDERLLQVRLQYVLTSKTVYGRIKFDFEVEKKVYKPHQHRSLL